MGDLALNLPAALNLVEPLDRQTLGERAYAKLADLLISGRLAPGEKLSLRAAADVLGVSIMPVREAVSRLIADKALEVTPNRAVRRISSFLAAGSPADIFQTTSRSDHGSRHQGFARAGHRRRRRHRARDRAGLRGRRRQGSCLRCR